MAVIVVADNIISILSPHICPINRYRFLMAGDVCAGVIKVVMISLIIWAEI
jgi:hypothetical protein